jgi:hypothetical protein
MILDSSKQQDSSGYNQLTILAIFACPAVDLDNDFGFDSSAACPIDRSERANVPRESLYNSPR